MSLEHDISVLGIARVLGDDWAANDVRATSDKDSLAGLQGSSGLVDGLPGLVYGSWVVIVSIRSNVVGFANKA
jgi:hypothetical protein